MAEQEYVPDQGLLHRTILHLLTVEDVSCTFQQTHGPNPFRRSEIDRCPICFEDIAPTLDVLTHHRRRSPSPGLPQRSIDRNNRSCSVSFCTQCVLRFMAERFGRQVDVRDPQTNLPIGVDFQELRCPYCNDMCVKGDEYGDLEEIQDTLIRLHVMRLLDEMIDRGEAERSSMGTGPEDVELATVHALTPLPMHRVHRVNAGTTRLDSLFSPAEIFRQRQRSQIFATIPPKKQPKYDEQGDMISVRRRIKDIVPFWEDQPHKVEGNACFPTQFGKMGKCEYWFQAYDLNTIMDFARRGHDVGIVAAQLVSALNLSPSARQTFQHFYSTLIFTTWFSTYPYFVYIQRGSLNVRHGDRSEKLTHIDFVPLRGRQLMPVQMTMRDYFRSPYEGYVMIRYGEEDNDPTNWYFDFAIRYT